MSAQALIPGLAILKVFKFQVSISTILICNINARNRDYKNVEMCKRKPMGLKKVYAPDLILNKRYMYHTFKYTLLPLLKALGTSHPSYLKSKLFIIHTYKFLLHRFQTGKIYVHCAVIGFSSSITCKFWMSGEMGGGGGGGRFKTL